MSIASLCLLPLFRAFSELRFLMLILVLLFMVPLVILHTTGTLKKAEGGIRWVPPQWVELYGGAVAGLAIVTVISAVIIMGMGLLINMWGCSIITGAAAGGLALTLGASAFAGPFTAFFDWFSGTGGIAFACILGAGFIFMGLKVQSTGGGESTSVLEQIIKDSGGVSPYPRQYIESKAHRPAAADTEPAKGRPHREAIDPAEVALNTVKDHMRRALALTSDGSHDKAIGEYNSAIEIDNSNALAYFNRGSLLMQRGQKTDALADFERVIALDQSPELNRMAQEHIDHMED